MTTGGEETWPALSNGAMAVATGALAALYGHIIGRLLRGRWLNVQSALDTVANACVSIGDVFVKGFGTSSRNKRTAGSDVASPARHMR